jgi:hypothetical protein
MENKKELAVITSLFVLVRNNPLGVHVGLANG